jgi:hypothetical protein
VHIKDAAHRRLQVAGDVGVPVLAGRAKAFCCAGVRCWSRKKITPLSISAAWISLKVGSSSGRERSTPRISAPAWGVSFSTWIEA